MHTAGSSRAGVLVDTELKYIQNEIMHATSKAARDICCGERWKSTQVICTVWSPGLADTSDHSGWESWMLWQDLPVLLPRPVSTVNQNASDMRFIGQGGVREEQGQSSLPAFDRGMGKYQRSISKKKCVIFTSCQLWPSWACILQSLLPHNTM